MRKYAYVAGLVVLIAGISAVRAEFQPIPSDALGGIAEQLVQAAEKQANAPIKFEANAEQAAGFFDELKGGLVLVPRSDLNEGALQSVTEEKGAPVAYLFLHQLKVAVGGKPFAGKLSTTTIQGGDGADREVSILRLSLKKESDEQWNLLVFGNDAKPIAKCAFRAESKDTQDAISIDVKDFEGEAGKLVFTVRGQYAADIELTTK